MAKAKILCMHGFGTNAKFMKMQSRSFMKLMSRQAELIFVDAPFISPKQFVLDPAVHKMIEGQFRSWIPVGTLMDEINLANFIKQIDAIRVVFQSASDSFDGILGFSQGAMVLHMLLKMNQQKIIQWKILDGIKFTLNLSGNHLKFSWLKKQTAQLQIPSLHLISEEDFLYPRCILHTAQFKNPTIIFHSYGHRFPKLGIKEAQIVLQFIRQHTKTTKRDKVKFQIMNFQEPRPSL